ncbi:Hypothetical predicted protein [Marmota monax]|uniref:Uncharacterized protein n=2 Tax=Marmota monax TaxID=9995 RepID=A0A5E4BV43_MARMO|nr:hypothetical protein GHT09_011245 [Marmota monax]VTJ72880.1 Hypothetical predicted protein [Marmota monax]
MAAKPPFNLDIDLCLIERPLDEFQAHLILWVTQRRDMVHLCCNRLKIFGKPTSHNRKVLRLLQLDCPEGGSALHLGALHLGCLCFFLGPDEEPEDTAGLPGPLPAHTSPEEQEQLIAQLTSQFLRMDCLWKSCVDAVLLLKGHLEQVLR